MSVAYAKSNGPQCRFFYLLYSVFEFTSIVKSIGHDRRSDDLGTTTVGLLHFVGYNAADR